jgi:deazaflavin-dependent oxidoreductase (nitroreductase family)
MPAPRWLARFNLRVTNPVLGPLAEHLPGMGVITHTGRRTHAQHRTPVMLFRHGNRYVVALTYGRESHWVQNILAEGGGKLKTAGRTLRILHPRLFNDPSRRAMPLLIRPFLKLLNVSDFLEIQIGSAKSESLASPA